MSADSSKKSKLKTIEVDLDMLSRLNSSQLLEMSKAAKTAEEDEPDFVWHEGNYLHIDDIPDGETYHPPVSLVDNTKGPLPPMRNFDKDRLETVKYLARGMSQDEILEYFLIVEELTPIEQVYFNRWYKAGVSAGKREAIEKLFIGMGNRNGAQVALQYLQTHGERFPAEGDLSAAKGSFSFNVNLDD